MRPLLALLLLIAATPFAYSGTLRARRESTQNCAVTCSGSDGQYEKGKTYTYDLETVTKIALSFEKVESVVTHKSKVLVTYHKDCEYSLKLTGVSLTGAEADVNYAPTLEKNELRFGFEYGRVVSVCPAKEDPAWSVNIKRGFLSAFQTGFDDSEELETDVNGDCSADYQREGSVITKKKDLTACQNSHHIHGLRNTPYSVRSKSQNLPLIKSNQDCRIELQDKRLFKSVCSEKHAVPQPFQQGTALETTVTQTVTFVDAKAASAVLQDFGKRSTLRFDHSELEHDTRKDSVQGAKKNIQYLCKESLLVRPQSGAEFVALVNNLRQLSSQDIASVSLDCVAFRDALAFCGSEACVEQLINLIKTGKPEDKAALFQAFSLVQRPSAGLVKKVADIAQLAPAQGLFGLSSLAHTYCLADEDCDLEEGVKKISEAILKKIPSGCVVPKTDNEDVLVALKAIGNIAANVGSVDVLNKCIDETKNPVVVRVVAASALRRKACSKSRDAALEKVFFNGEENVELRIVAFRQLMECVDENLINKVIAQLAEEKSNQVGSYVWSYLNTKRSSSNPAFATLKALLRRQTLPQKFNKDPRKFSRYTELGYHNQKANVGAHLDTSVVFVPENYVPRQLGANATIHLFGKSINVFEVETRLEGLDRPIDELLGPNGFFTNPGRHDFARETYSPKSSKVSSLKDAFLKKIKYDEGRVSTSLGLKLFGDDVLYESYSSNNFADEVAQNFSTDAAIQQMAKLRNFNFDKNYFLIEVVHTIPTVSGFPLRFTFDAAASVKVKLSTKTDVSNVLKAKAEFETVFSNSPSGNLFVSGAVTLQTSRVRQGVRFETTLHSASSFISKNSLKDGKYTSVIEVPEDKVEILHTKSDILKIVNNVETSLGAAKGEEKRVCTGNLVGKAVGLQGCFEFEKRLPFIQSTVSIEKTDAALKSYEVVIGGKKTPGAMSMELSFDTPQSKVNRKMKADFNFNANEKKISVNLDTPFRKINVNGDLNERKKLEDYGASVKVQVTDAKQTNEYALNGDLKIESPNGKNRYVLKAKADGDAKTAADLSTVVEYSLQKPYGKLEFSLDKVFSKIVKLNSEFGLENTKFFAKVDYDGVNSNSKVDVNGVFNGINDIKGKIDGDYNIGKYQGKVNLEAEHNLQLKNQDHKLTQKLKAASTNLGNLEYTWSSEKKDDNVDVALTVNHGTKKNSIVISSKKQNNGQYNIEAVAKSDCLKLDHKVNAEYLMKPPQEFKLKVDLDAPNLKGVSALLEHKLTTAPMIKLDGQMILKYPGREITVKNNIAEEKKGRYNAKTLAQWASNGKIELDSNIVYRPSDVEYTVETTATVQGVPEKVYIKKSYTKQQNVQSVTLIAKHGSAAVIDAVGSIDGQFGSKQNLKLILKSDKFDHKIDYTATSVVEPSANDLKISADIKRNSKDFAKGAITVPKSVKAAKQLYKGDFSWDLDTKARSGSAEYKIEKNGDEHKHAVHVDADKQYNFDLELECKKDISLKTKLQKAGKTISSADVKLGPLSWNDFEIDGKLVSDEPLPKRDIKTKSSFKWKDNELNVEGRVESNGERYMAKGDWKKDDHKEYRHYAYNFFVEGGDALVKLGQQFKVKDTFTVTKFVSDVETNIKNYKYKVESDFDFGADFTKGSYGATWNDKKYSTELEYSHKNGRRHYKQVAGYDGKEATLELESIYRDNEVAVNSNVKLPGDHGFGQTKFGCKKEAGYWNCNLLGNVNDKYTLGGSNSITPTNTKVNYQIRAAELVNNDGKLEVVMNKAASKYAVAAEMNHFGKKYALDVNVDQAKGEVKLKTPQKEYGSGSVTVTKVKDGEYELKTVKDGNANMNVQCKIVDQNDDKKFEIKITEIENPFKLSAENKISGSQQKSAFELVLDPDTTKRAYGLDVDLDADQDKFRGFVLTVKHPKRQMQIKAERPTKTKYLLTLQPDLGGKRAPTVYEVDYHHDLESKNIKFHGKVSDPALKKPISVKFDGNMNVADESTYTGQTSFELDYAGEESKIFRWSNKFERSTAAKRVRRAAPSAKTHVFLWESKTEHVASGLYVRAFFNSDRVEKDGTLVPTRAHFGLESKNLEKVNVEYALEAKSDWAKLASVKLFSPEGFMKAEFEKKSDKQYLVNFYHNNESPSLKCDLSKNDEGIKLVVVDGKTGDVKLHSIARIMNDQTAEIAAWHTENNQKITDARFTVKLSKAHLIRAKLFVRPEVNKEIAKTTLLTVKTVKEPKKNQFFRNTLLSFYKANRELNADIVETFTTLTKGWTEEQRVFMKEFGTEYETLVDLAEENLEMAREIVLVSYDTVYQKVEEIVDSIPQTEFKDVMHNIKTSFDDLPGYIAKVVEPFKAVAAQISQEIQKSQDGLAKAFDYIEENMKLKELRAAITDFINKMIEADFIRTAIKQARDFSKEYAMPEVSTALGDVEMNLDEYKGKLEKAWIQIKDQLIDYAAIFGVSSAVESVLEPVGNFELERRITDLVHFLRGKLTSKDISDKIWNKWLPRVTKKDLKKLEIEVEIPIPVRSNSLQDLVDQVHPERLVAIKNDIAQKISSITLTPEQQNDIAQKISSITLTPEQQVTLDTLFSTPSICINPFR
uniref:Vitellogenin domain-containing protein n=1 Tax=Steinernema glaseri TaxID=37863 RepID=A0A1I7ZPH0_9BILA